MWLKHYFNQFPEKQVRYVSLSNLKYFHHIHLQMKNMSIEKWKVYLKFKFLHHILQFFSISRKYMQIFFDKSHHYSTRNHRKNDEIRFSGIQTKKHYQRSQQSYQVQIWRLEQLIQVWWKHATKFFISQNRQEYEGKRKRVELIKNIIMKVLLTMVEKSDWQPQTKTNIKLKLERLKFFVGWDRQIETLDENSNINLEYFDEYMMLGYKKTFTDLLKSYGQDLTSVWKIPQPLLSNAIYSQEGNFIIVPLAIFHEPFYCESCHWSDNKTNNSHDLKQKSFLKDMSGIGHIIAHEIFHSIDPGSRFIDGKYIINNLFYHKDEERYKRVLRGMNKMYEDYWVSEMKGERSKSHEITKQCQTENFADINSTLLIFNVLQIYFQEKFNRDPNQKEISEFTKNFILSHYEKESNNDSNGVEVHNNSKLRIDVPLKNMMINKIKWL